MIRRRKKFYLGCKAKTTTPWEDSDFRELAWLEEENAPEREQQPTKPETPRPQKALGPPRPRLPLETVSGGVERGGHSQSRIPLR